MPSTTPDPRQTVDDLRAENEALRALLRVAESGAHHGLWERDRATGLGRWDAELFEFLGLDPQRGAPDLDGATAMLHQQDRARVARAYAESLQTPGTYQERFRIRGPGGRVMPVRAAWVVPRQGRRVFGLLVDDSLGSEDQRRLALARRQLEQIAPLVGLFVWRRDYASGRFLVGEEVWAPPGQLAHAQGMTLEEFGALVHPQDRDSQILPADALDMDDTPVVAEIRIRPPGVQAYRTLLTRRVVQRDDAGNVVGMLGIGVDVTEQAEAHKRHRQLLERFDLVAGAAGVGLWTVDPAGGAQTWNDAMRAIYGLLDAQPPVPKVPSEVSSFVLAEDRAAVEGALRSALAAPGRSFEVQYRIRRPDGKVRALAGRARLLTGEPALLCGIVLDVTDAQRAAQALRDKEAAERADQAKSEFLSRVSHELRTPLNAVIGFSELLLADDGSALPAARREWLTMVRDAGRHLMSLVEDLLTIGRQASAMPPDTGCELGPVVAEAIAWQQSQAQQAGVRVSHRGAAPRAVGSQRHWRQIVANLLSNAVKYNRVGGSVVIELGSAAAPGAGPGGRAGGAWPQLSVRDDGRGLAEAQQHEVFQPFNRLGAEHGGIPGTGLGLSIVRQLVEAMGGRVALASVPGQGTTVTVLVPPARTPDTAPAPEPPAPCQRPEHEAAPDAAGSPGHAPKHLPPRGGAAPGAGLMAGAAPACVVYVEDNPVNATLVREILAGEAGLRLELVGSVAEARALLREARPTLLLVDMHLPDGSGLELLAQLREDGLTRAARHVIALSADVMPAEVERALAGGFDDHWAKPIDVAAFLAKVRRLVGG